MNLDPATNRVVEDLNELSEEKQQKVLLLLEEIVRANPDNITLAADAMDCAELADPVKAGRLILAGDQELCSVANQLETGDIELGEYVSLADWICSDRALQPL